MKASFSTYLATWAAEFLARADRVRHLIGDAHWLSDGGHKESLLTQFLERHLPEPLHLARGFVRPRDAERACSPEVDVLIADFQEHPPIFNEGMLLIVPPASVVAHLQSKSGLNCTSLREAIANVVAVQHVIERYRNSQDIWRGIVFASCPDTRTPESLVKTLVDVLSDQAELFATIPKAVHDRPTRLAPSLLPKCIATYERFAIFISEIAQDTVHVRAFDTGSLGIACVACDLFAFTVARRGGAAAAELMQIIESAVESEPYAEDISL